VFSLSFPLAGAEGISLANCSGFNQGQDCVIGQINYFIISNALPNQHCATAPPVCKEVRHARTKAYLGRGLRWFGIVLCA
jgi:hypothetical protein